ncbi:MAG: rod shape-determining protein MreC [Thermodesulfovibrionales bacterium]|nr:rod shape-determining protein MreC [Thermodesulfovibrionales bacterium]
MIRVKHGFIILFFIILVSFLIISIQKREYTRVREILIYPLDVFNLSISQVKGIFNNIFNAVKENEALKKELYELKIERQRYGEILQENKRLKAILSLKESSLLSFHAVAKPVARGYDRLLNTIIIDKGKQDGIKKDMAVITTNGLAGKVYSVRDNYAEILLMKDPNFSVSVRLQKSRQEGVISGTGRDYCLLKYIPLEHKVEQGEAVITSGLDGIFPPGIPVGVVSSIGAKTADFFQYIEITPYQLDSKIEEVIILKSYTSNGR